jgi:hypothetical protein
MHRHRALTTRIHYSNRPRAKVYFVGTVVDELVFNSKSRGNQRDSDHLLNMKLIYLGEKTDGFTFL